MAGTGGTTTYTPMSVLTGTTLLPKKPVVVAAKPTVTATKAPTTLQSLMSSTSGSSSSSSSKPKTTTSTASASSSAPKLTSAQKTAITSLAGLPAALPAANKNAISSAFLNALAQAARTGGAVSNPPGLSGAEADKLRSQFYSNMPVQRIVDNTGSPQAMLSYDVNKRIDPALLNSLSSPFGVEAPPLPMVPGGTGIGFGQTPAAGFPATAVAPFMAQGIRPGQPSGLPAAPFMAQGVRPGTPAGMPAAPFMAQGVRPGQPSGLPFAPVPPAPAGGGYTTDMLNSKGIARYLLPDIMGQQQPAPAIVAQQQGERPFNPLDILFPPAYGAEYPAATPTDPNPLYSPAFPTSDNVRAVPTRTYRAGQVNPVDVLLSQIGSFSPFSDVKRGNALVLADPFYQANRVGTPNPTIGDVMTTPSAYDTSGFATGPMFYYGADNVAPRPVPAQSMVIPSRIDEAAIADKSKNARLTTVDAKTRNDTYDRSLGYPLLPEVAELQKSPPVPVAFPTTAGIDGAINPNVAPVVPRERPSLYDFAVSNPGWAIEKMRAIEDAGTMADNSDYGNLVSGLENSPNRTADMMSQSGKLRAAEEYANANDIPVSDTYGGAEDKTDQLLNIYEEKVAPTLPKSGGTTAGAVFKPGAGQFVGTNGYVYEQGEDGGFKRVGKVPGYTDAQLYEAANKGTFRNPQAVPLGPSKATGAKKKPAKKTEEAKQDDGDGFFQWFTDIRNGIEEQRNKNRKALGLEPRKADGGMVKGYKDGGSTSGSSSTTTSGAPAGYTPPTQAQIDALYAPYFQQAVMPPPTYQPGISGEFNYFPTMPKPVTPPSNPLIQSGTTASDWFNKYMNAKNAADKKAAHKDIATGTTTFHSMFDKYRNTLGRKAEPTLQGWLDWYGKQSFAEGGAVPDARLVLGHGGPKEDKIPARIDGVQEARLSNGEFVMTAAAVKNAGDGDMTKGAERLMQLNEMLSYGRPANKLNVETVKGKAK